MNARDQRKVAEKGITILHKRDYPSAEIWYKSPANPTSWLKLKEEFASKAARDRYVKRLLERMDFVEL